MPAPEGDGGPRVRGEFGLPGPAVRPFPNCYSTRGITAQEVQDYEVGANQISASHMRDIVAAMEVPVSFFFEGLARALEDAA